MKFKGKLGHILKNLYDVILCLGLRPYETFSLPMLTCLLLLSLFGSQVAMLMRYHKCSVSGNSRRQNLTANFLFFGLLQSFLPSSAMILQLQVEELGCRYISWSCAPHSFQFSAFLSIFYNSLIQLQRDILTW